MAERDFPNFQERWGSVAYRSRATEALKSVLRESFPNYAEDHVASDSSRLEQKFFSDATSKKEYDDNLKKAIAVVKQRARDGTSRSISQADSNERSQRNVSFSGLGGPSNQAAVPENGATPEFRRFCRMSTRNKTTNRLFSKNFNNVPEDTDAGSKLLGRPNLLGQSVTEDEVLKLIPFILSASHQVIGSIKSEEQIRNVSSAELSTIGFLAMEKMHVARGSAATPTRAQRSQQGRAGPSTPATNTPRNEVDDRTIAQVLRRAHALRGQYQDRLETVYPLAYSISDEDERKGLTENVKTCLKVLLQLTGPDPIVTPRSMITLGYIESVIKTMLDVYGHLEPPGQAGPSNAPGTLASAQEETPRRNKSTPSSTKVRRSTRLQKKAADQGTPCAAKTRLEFRSPRGSNNNETNPIIPFDSTEEHSRQMRSKVDRLYRRRLEDLHRRLEKGSPVAELAGNISDDVELYLSILRDRSSHTGKFLEVIEDQIKLLFETLDKETSTSSPAPRAGGASGRRLVRAPRIQVTPSNAVLPARTLAEQRVSPSEDNTDLSSSASGNRQGKNRRGTKNTSETSSRKVNGYESDEGSAGEESIEESKNESRAESSFMSEIDERVRRLRRHSSWFMPIYDSLIRTTARMTVTRRAEMKDRAAKCRDILTGDYIPESTQEGLQMVQDAEDFIQKVERERKPRNRKELVEESVAEDEVTERDEDENDSAPDDNVAQDSDHGRISRSKQEAQLWPQVNEEEDADVTDEDEEEYEDEY